MSQFVKQLLGSLFQDDGRSTARLVVSVTN